jgi:tight adherence protein C
MLIFAIVGFFGVTLALFVGGGWLLMRQTSALNTGGSGSSVGSFESSDGPQWAGALSQLAGSIGRDGSDSATKKLLFSAGFRGRSAQSTMAGAKVVCGAVLTLLMSAVVLSTSGDFLMVALVAVMAAFVGSTIPEWYLRRCVKKRLEAIRKGLPDFLDLLVISVESGVSLNQAFSDTARDLRHLHPVIADELNVMELELQTGMSRPEALKNLGSRSGEPELKKLTSLLIQAERFGSSVVKVLRTQARYMRTRRKQKAEELAHKVSVKMIFPIFFLIMPVVFLVTAGPALFMLFTSFADMSR